MKKELSILLPVYNNVCVGLVQQLLEQTKEFRNLQFEILVADDGSDDAQAIKRNQEIAQWENCKYITLEKNYGRSKVRNFLAKTAQYEWLMFLDSDVKLPNFFLREYLNDTEESVVYGGVRVLGDQFMRESNLKCRYESQEMASHLIEERQANPYKSFRTTGFLASKEVMTKCHFDERFVKYGYEDVLFGKTLCENRIPILHINNPVHIDQFDNNSDYLAKIEESLQTLKAFQHDLEGYSTILAKVNSLKRWHTTWIVKLWHALFKGAERHNLLGKSPNLTVLKLYKLGYFLAQ